MKPLLLALTLFAVAAAHALEWTVHPVDFDGTPIHVAVPADLAPVGMDHPAMAATRAALPPQNRLIAGFYAPVDSPFFCQVQQVVPTRAWRYNEAEWKQMLGGIDAALRDVDAKKIADDIAGRLNNALGTGVELEKPVMLPVIDRSDRHVVFPMLMATRATRDGQTVRSVLLIGCQILVLHDRMVHVFLYEPFVGKETYDVLATKAREMAKRTLEANR